MEEEYWNEKMDDLAFIPAGNAVIVNYNNVFTDGIICRVVRNVYCMVKFKDEMGSVVSMEEMTKGTVRVGAIVEVKHPGKDEFIEAIISKIQDCSRYTVVFANGDIATYCRAALHLKESVCPNLAE